jgi:hypothetical protein
VEVAARLDKTRNHRLGCRLDLRVGDEGRGRGRGKGGGPEGEEKSHTASYVGHWRRC